MAVLLLASLIAMLYYSRKAVKEEALHDATQTLEGTVQRIDNILLSIEQTTGNMYFSMQPFLDRPDMMYTFSRKIVETNHYVSGCAIAFRPGYFKGRELFMAYVHRSSDSLLVESDTFGDRPYTEQVWYAEPMKTGMPKWLNPLKEMNVDTEPIFTFCLPFPGADGRPIGVIGVDVSLSLLSKTVLSAKPSPNSYSTLLAGDGSFIVHPDSNKLLHQTIFTLTGKNSDKTMKQAAEAMVSGKTGYQQFTMYGNDYYVFYKPFQRAAIRGRSMEKLGWSAGIIYPKDDIFGDYNILTYYVLGIAVVGLLLLFVLSCAIMHRQLKPLLMLAASAQRISKGNYDEPIPDSHQADEIGHLQDNFQQMRQSLSAHVRELEQLTATLEEHGRELRVAYNQAQKADRMKTAFLHNMTYQMVSPTHAILGDVEALCDTSSDRGQKESGTIVSDIQQHSTSITELLNNLINMSEEETGKEAGHV
jgi:HAMP domain-containing protein